METNFSPALQFIRQTLMSLQGVTEKLCFETPAFYVNKKIFARMKEDGETIAVYTEERDKWITGSPEIFYITEHYRKYNYMLIRLELVEPSDLQEILKEAWRKRAPKRLRYRL